MAKSVTVADRASCAFVPLLLEHSHFATEQLVFGPHNAQVTSRNGRSENGASVTELQDLRADVGQHRVLVTTRLRDRCNSGLDTGLQCIEVWRKLSPTLDSVNRRLNGSATFMAEYDEKLCVKIAVTILESPKAYGIGEIAGDTNHEQISDMLVED